MANSEQSDSAGGFSARLIAEDGVEYELAGEMKVGRVEECDITIEDPRVSRAHAVIRVEGERVTVEDLGSANGSRINDRRTDGAAALADGDTLSFENHHFKVSISGLSEPEEAAPDDDATVVNMPADDDATVVGGYSSPEPEPAPAPVPEAPPKTSASGDAFNLPGSWVESEDDGEHTRILMPGAAEASGAEPAHERESEQAHMQVVVDGAGADLFELEVSGGPDPDVWEIGRSEECQIGLSEPSVSSRHAQLIHQNGRWRLVNLVSANGIFVNDEKRLTAYLADGDRVRLGNANLVFRTAVGAAAAAAPAPQTASSSGGEAAASGGKSKGLIIGIVVAVTVLGAAAWLML